MFISIFFSIAGQFQEDLHEIRCVEYGHGAIWNSLFLKEKEIKKGFFGKNSEKGFFVHNLLFRNVKDLIEQLHITQHYFLK